MFDSFNFVSKVFFCGYRDLFFFVSLFIFSIIEDFFLDYLCLGIDEFFRSFLLLVCFYRFICFIKMVYGKKFFLCLFCILANKDFFIGIVFVIKFFKFFV